MKRAVAVLLCVAVRAVAAQGFAIDCVEAITPGCRGTVAIATADAMQSVPLALLVTNAGVAVPNAMVRLKATGGALMPDTAITDATGVARTIWFRHKGSDPVLVAAEASVPASGGQSPKSAVTSVTLVPRDPVAGLLRPELEGGYLQSWFEKSQLPRPVVVRLRPVPGAPALTKEECVRNRVHFRSRGALQSVSPDTAVPYLNQQGACMAETYWSMGEGIGERRLDVRIVPGKGFKTDTVQVAEAWTRATPRFIAGFASGWLRPYTTINPAATRTVRVEVTDASGVVRSYDTTETTGAVAVKDVPGTRKNSAVAALSLPIPIARWEDWDNLSLTVGVDLADIGARQYYGLSVLRLVGRWVPVIEVLPVDLHALAMYARQPELIDPRCAPTACVTRNRTKFQGWNYMVSADATSLVSDLVKKLAP